MIAIGFEGKSPEKMEEFSKSTEGKPMNKI
jgi:hypothetical protein